MSLQRYKQKRNFGDTPEPEGKVLKRKMPELLFVIQKHSASHLHYDFRLELNGVLVSWAVPKGIPTKKADKRLAMHVEDHPIDYGDFEGVIPEGNYGAGSVMVWDTGVWEPLESAPDRALEKGKLKFILRGKKLNGEWTLVRMRARSAASGKDEWLLIKSGEDVAPITAKRDDQSVLTRRTMAQIAGQKTRTWKSNRETDSKKKSFKERIAAAAQQRGAQRHSENGASPQRAKKNVAPAVTSNDLLDKPSQTTPKASAQTGAVTWEKCPVESPKFINPMKAVLVNTLSPQEDWLLELKHDGYRALAVKDGGRVELFSRNQKKLTASFPTVVRAIQKLSPDKLVLDGEIVALDERGHGSFQLLQNHERISDPGTLVLYAFDLLNFNGRNIRALPLAQRRGLLESLMTKADEPLRFSVALPGAPKIVLTEIKRLGLEGLIAKKPDSPYEAGRRSNAWVKIKCLNEQEFVVGGYTAPKGSRDHFGALLVGYYESGQLHFASKVGTGFTQATLRDLFKQFKPFHQSACPFINLPTKRSGKFGQGVSAAEMRNCTWLKPTLVAQVRFTEWTGDGGLRHPVFLGLRSDKRAEEVVREVAIVQSG